MSTENSKQDPSWDTVRVVVSQVYETYVVTYPLKRCGDLLTTDSVTFSLIDWKGKTSPDKGQVIDLAETHLYSRGWRAKSARPVSPQTTSQ